MWPKERGVDPAPRCRSARLMALCSFILAKQTRAVFSWDGNEALSRAAELTQSKEPGSLQPGHPQSSLLARYITLLSVCSAFETHVLTTYSCSSSHFPKLYSTIKIKQNMDLMCLRLMICANSVNRKKLCISFLNSDYRRVA